ncbi:ClbS/DfsB family four-helix bundle protein [Roseiflexus sp.]|uniref:ClbS/DfsB family four-helix bundle protein n=1 Tax=Roseiflexus sp. TaxID=2562120 RepID=UPI00398A6F92
MNSRILAALAHLSDEEASAPLPSSPWSIRNVVVHLWAWQQHTIAHTETALANREPVFPQWSAAIDSDAEDSVDRINAWIAATHRDTPWLLAYQQWREGHLHPLDISTHIDERDLLDTARYPWLGGRPPALILLATGDHDWEHGAALGTEYKHGHSFCQRRDAAPPGAAARRNVRTGAPSGTVDSLHALSYATHRLMACPNMAGGARERKR